MALIKKFRIKSFKKVKPVLKIEKVSLAFKKRSILENINFSLNQSEILGLLGPNGVGKTSLLRSISEISPPIKGFIHSTFLSTLFIPTNGGYRHELSVLQILNDMSDERTDTILKRLDEFRIADIQDKSLASISDGQKKRVMLAGIDIKENTLLIIDEPFNTLDNDGLLLLLNVFSEICYKGGAVVLSTHTSIKEIISNDFHEKVDYMDGFLEHQQKAKSVLRPQAFH